MSRKDNWNDLSTLERIENAPNDKVKDFLVEKAERQGYKVY